MHGVGWWIIDHLVGSDATHTADAYWHVAPRWRCDLAQPHVCHLSHGDTALALASTLPLTLLSPANPLAMASLDYGTVTPAPVVRGTVTARVPFTFATFIPATAAFARDLTIEPLRVDVSPGGHWHAAAFRVRWQRGAMTVLSAIEGAGKPGADNGTPPQRWGPAELQSDARVAVLLDQANGRSEAVLVNGSFVRSHGTHEIVSLSRRVLLLRLTPAQVAPSVHEVGVR